MSTTWKYLPILKWKQGERIALRELFDAHWEVTVPLIEVMSEPVGQDSTSFRAGMDEVGRKMEAAIPDGKPIAIDARYVDPAYGSQAKLLFAVCKRIARTSKRAIIPVVSETMTALNLSQLEEEFPEVILRIHTPSVAPMQITGFVANLTGQGYTKKRIHILVDQFSIVKEDVGAKTAAVKPFLQEAFAVGCRSVTLSGGAFPINLTGYKQGAHTIPRVEWQVWSRIQKTREFPGLRYADYTVSNPAMPPAIDPLQLNPSIAIRYAGPTDWHLFKGGGFKGGRPGTYQGLCKLLMIDPVYSGSGFSFGDSEYAKKMASPKKPNPNGNPSSWRKEATSHHIAFVVSKL
ncbi:MAG: hypothetical protein EPO06_08660 [Burkholderiaceae bacterium]|nr:MAG: hypothetical protein EPO06_08660 [Burkholderiaceae bacterium]